MNAPVLNRRRFLAAAVPAIAGWSAGAEPGLSGRVIRLGHIGTGGQGMSLLRNFLPLSGARSVAVADPFRQRRDAAAALVREKQGHSPVVTSDFRHLLEDPGIDAVVIATPDHWHVPIALAAIKAGKDVYLEKPLGRSLAENNALLEACRKSGRIFQYGTQQRSQSMLRKGVELVLNGVIGDLERIEIWAPRGAGGGSLAGIPVPEGLDYEMYIGPAPMRPCTRDRITSAASWHCSDYSLGFIAGWGAHPLDIALWGQEFDIAGPWKIRGTGKAATPDGLFNAISSWKVELQFHSGLAAGFSSDDAARTAVEKYRRHWAPDGTTFFGSKGWVSLSRGGVEASNMDWFRIKGGTGWKSLAYRSNYYSAFVEAIGARTRSVAPIEDAIRSDAISHLAVLAIESGREVTWDPAMRSILGPESLRGNMSRPTWEGRTPAPTVGRDSPPRSSPKHVMAGAMGRG